jgi:predicted Zn-dependent protease
VLACGGPAAEKRERQSSFAAELLPATLQPTPTGTEVKKARVRVYADDEHRAQTLSWERKFSVMLRRANKVLGPTAGLELEITETKSWPRKSSASDIDAMLVELEDLDPGGDVHFVIGVATALPEVTTAMHQLGVARPLGKHIVIRGLNDTKEVELLGSVLNELSKDSREKLWSQRKKHKETAVFLHELGHVLGALHTKERGRLLYPTYDSKIVAFTPANARLIRIAAGFRVSAGPTGDRTGELQALRAYLAATKYPAWDEKEVQLLNALIEQRIASGGATTTELGALSTAVRPADRVEYRDAVGLADNGRILEAWEKAEPLFEYYPDEPAIQVLRCRLASARRMSGAEVAELCEKAAELAPANVTPSVKVALAAAKADDRPAALAALARARKRLLSAGQRDDVSAEDLEAAWEEMADAYQQLGLVTLAGDAAERSGGAASIAKWARNKAARYAVPPLGSALRKKLSAESDADYMQAVTGILRKIYQKDYAGAAAGAAEARARFGDQAGIDAALCDMAIRQRNYGKAKSLCKRAIARFDGGAWAHYLYGLLLKRDKNTRGAVRHLARAVELGLDHKHPYQVLAELYRAAGNKAGLEKLSETHAAQFGQPL